MSEKVQRLLESLGGITSIEEIGRFIDLLRDVYGLEHVVYYAMSLGASSVPAAIPSGGRLDPGGGFWRREGRSLAALSYSDAWSQHYADSGYARIDPTLEGAMLSFLPVDWKEVPWDTPRRRAFLHEAVEAGIGNQGYTIPVRGPDNQFAAFTINKTCDDDTWRDFIARHRSDFLLIAHFVHERALRIANVGLSTQAINLSSRERDVLSFLSIGKSRAQIAHDLNISENTLRVYIDSARHKLGALNAAHAVSIAVGRGIVNI